jgi:hypothetical protein
MRQRKISDQDISKAIASRVAQSSSRRDRQHRKEKVEPEISGLSIDQLTASAIEFLQAGRRSAAAALFEAARRDNASDSEVRNNYGFCILPDDPQGGLREIHAAQELGFIHTGVTLANRMYGLFLLKRFASALEAAEKLWNEDHVDHSAYLWDWRKEPENTTIVQMSPRHYVVQFALDIAEATGDLHRAALWAARAESCGLPRD